MAINVDYLNLARDVILKRHNLPGYQKKYFLTLVSMTPETRVFFKKIRFLENNKMHSDHT